MEKKYKLWIEFAFGMVRPGLLLYVRISGKVGVKTVENRSVWSPPPDVLQLCLCYTIWMSDACIYGAFFPVTRCECGYFLTLHSSSVFSFVFLRSAVDWSYPQPLSCLQPGAFACAVRKINASAVGSIIINKMRHHCVVCLTIIRPLSTTLNTIQMSIWLKA